MLFPYRYDAYGKTLGETGTTDNKYLFAGEQFDQGLGDYYLRQRFYDTSTGRFTRRDTYEGRRGEPLTLHKYVYANNNPSNYTDPLGLFASLAESNAAFTVFAILATIKTFDILTRSYNPEPLPPFPIPSPDKSKTLVNQNDDWHPGALEGITGHTPKGANETLVNRPNAIRDFIRYIFTIQNSGSVRLPDLTGRSRAGAEQELINAGFKDMGLTAGGYAKWYHPDGSRVQIDPNGQVKRSGPKTKPAGGGKTYRPRIDQYGNEIPYNPGGSEHETGEIITP